MSINLKIEGLDSVVGRLAKLSENVEHGLRDGLIRGGEIVRTQAQADCPRDTGRLQDSIMVWQEDGTSVFVGTNVEYGIYVEFGTGYKAAPSIRHTTKEGWVYFNEVTGRFVYTTGQAPQPFLLPALISQKEAVIQAVRQGILEAV